MWIASKLGFFSIVQKEGAWHVRARVKRDLENLVVAALPTAKAKIQRWPAADYRWRICLTRAEHVTRVFAALQESIDYPNFKSEIAQRPDQREKLHAYHELWGAMQEIQVLADGHKDAKDAKDACPALVSR